MSTKKCRISPRNPEERLALLRRIKDAGCPVEIDEALRADHGGLIIRQVGPVALGSMFDLDPYGTGLKVNVSITCETSEFCIDDYEVVLPWEDPRFQWLEPVEGVPEWRAYSFPGKHPLEFPRDEVINHLKPRLRRGHEVEGLLLGWGPVSIPDRYARSGIKAKLLVFDHLGNSCSEPLLLCVDRSGRRVHKPSGKSSTSRLFDEVEGIPTKVATPLPENSPGEASRKDFTGDNGKKGVSWTGFNVAD